MIREENTEMTEKDFRIALTCDDFNAAIAFYRDGLGLNPGEV